MDVPRLVIDVMTTEIVNQQTNVAIPSAHIQIKLFDPPKQYKMSYLSFSIK